MSFDTYDVYFAGRIIEGKDPAEVRNKVGALFKLEGEKLERLFSGQPVAIKKGIDMDQAVKYRVAFRDAGALVEIRPIEQPRQAAPAAEPQTTAPPTAPDYDLSPANTGSLIDCAMEVKPQVIPDISAIHLDAPGTLIDETEPPPPANIDTGELSVSQAREGSLEDCQIPTPAAPLPDISHLKIDESAKNDHK
ncbi:hypothetical protein DJ031_03155 [bacterium endosymbiont of Escarpia laminata]|nr:MAG: hypothetical protein DJ031_03155 [bacterium endosymbiont of Escarpia laminata]